MHPNVGGGGADCVFLIRIQSQVSQAADEAGLSSQKAHEAERKHGVTPCDCICKQAAIISSPVCGVDSAGKTQYTFEPFVLDEMVEEKRLLAALTYHYVFLERKRRRKGGENIRYSPLPTDDA